MFGDISKDVEEVDITVALSSAALSAKDENELVQHTQKHLGLSSLLVAALHP